MPDVNPMLAYLPPDDGFMLPAGNDRRRRATNAMMAAQYDRPTSQDTTVTERAGLLPLGTYANGMTGLAFPGFLADPVSGFIREATNPVPYLNRSEDEKRQTVETGFDVAGAAMVGGLAAPKPSGIVGMFGGRLAKTADIAGEMPPSYIARANQTERPQAQVFRGYHGSGGDSLLSSPWPESGPWGSSSPRVAETYTNIMAGDVPTMFPLDYRFNNPHVVDAHGRRYGLRPGTINTDVIAGQARDAGHDGVVFRNIRDAAGAERTLADTYAPLKPGTVYSATTGDLLYANGGKSGAAAGAALSGAGERPSLLNRMLSMFGKGTSETPAIVDSPIAARNRAINDAIEAGATGPETYRGFSGSETNRQFDSGFTRGPWASPSAEVANTYANVSNGRPGNVAPMEFRFKNPTVIDAQGELWRDIPVGDGAKATTNMLANSARNAGHDGIVIRNVRDHLSFGGDPGDVYHALKPGTTYSALTGDLLYTNGGKSGAAAGAALTAPNDPAINELLRQYGIDLPRRHWSNAMLPGDA